MTAGPELFLIEDEELIELGPEAAEAEAAAELAAAAAELAETPAETELWPPIADGVGGGIMAVIIETEDGEAISEATGVTESEPGLLSRVVVERELAALRLKHDCLLTQCVITYSVFLHILPIFSPFFVKSLFFFFSLFKKNFMSKIW